MAKRVFNGWRLVGDDLNTVRLNSSRVEDKEGKVTYDGPPQNVIVARDTKDESLFVPVAGIVYKGAFEGLEKPTGAALGGVKFDLD